ncbi:hypothetical protein KSS87_012590 [Heliosperma pusillum]|nr:hypothetical protein KSS87_012590 [Heliosperma pusillum]
MAATPCIFCQIARSDTSTHILHIDDKVVAFQDIKPSAFRHYLVIPIKHLPTVKELQRVHEDYALVSHMLDVGKMLLQRDASQSTDYRWKQLKYMSLGPLGAFIEAEKLLAKLSPVQTSHI